MTTIYVIMIKGEVYSMILYECTNMDIEEVHEYISERYCLEPEEYDLIVDHIES